MKYIRTKDGRIFYAKKKSKKDVKLANDNLHWEAIPKGCNDYFTLDYEDDEIIKAADTLEELCDKIIRVFKDEKIPQGYNKYCIYDDNEYKWFMSFKENKEKVISKLEEADWFGAIWTDKGLIYVATMNDKGELELL